MIESLRKFCELHENYVQKLQGFLDSEEQCRKRYKQLLEVLSSLLLSPECTEDIADSFPQLLPALIAEAIPLQLVQDTAQHRLYCVTLGTLAKKHSEIIEFTHRYFDVNPAPFEDPNLTTAKKRKTSIDIPDALLLRACLNLVTRIPNFKHKWKWSRFYDYLAMDNDEIKWLALCCISELLNIPEAMRLSLASKYLQNTEKFSTDLQQTKRRTPLHLKDEEVTELTEEVQEIITVAGVSLPLFAEKASDQEQKAKRLKNQEIPKGSSRSKKISKEISMEPRNLQKDIRLVKVDSTLLNLRNLSLAVTKNNCVWIRGPVGSGKTSLVHYLAGQTGVEIQTVQIGEETDSKTLIGAYRCTDIPGEFLYAPGPLTISASKGNWLLLEDADTAPADILSLLRNFLETGILFAPGCREPIRPRSSFKLFLTERTSRFKSSSFPVQCATVNLHPLTKEELVSIVQEMFPALNTISSRIVEVFLLFSEPGGENERRTGRQTSTRDLVKWCSRAVIGFDVSSPDSALKIFQDAVDIFCCSVPDREQRLALAIQVAHKLGIIKTKAEYFCEMHKPNVSCENQNFTIGRASLKMKKAMYAKLDPKKSNFSFTRPSLCLLERIASCVSKREPVLLVGETGTGKTTSVQFLAETLGYKLIVINMNQQSETADLLGGYKPVDVKYLIQPIREEFEILFRSYFALEPNRKFLQHLGRCFEEKKWRTMLNLMKHSSGAALRRLQETLEREQEIKKQLEEERSRFAREALNSPDVQSEKQRGQDEEEPKTPQSSKKSKIGSSGPVLQTPPNSNLKRQSTSPQRSSKKQKLCESEDSPTAKKLEGALRALQKTKETLSKWQFMSKKLEKLDRQLRTEHALAFSFIEGSLVKAIRNGHWVLLDEINLATSETLECLSGLLESAYGSIRLLERGDEEQVRRHQDFVLFACMNPATDVGKKELPTGLRNRFTEFFVDELTDPTDLHLLTTSYLQDINLTYQQHEKIVKFYLNILKEAATSLTDGTGKSPKYSLRTLCRALRSSKQNPFGNPMRSLYEGLCLSFLTQLDRRSYPVVRDMITKAVYGEKKAAAKMTIQRPKLNGENFVCIEGYWIPRGSEEPKIAENYILTPTVRTHLRSLLRSVALSLPLLLQGDTSSGKTSLITYLARASGHKCVRVNNHEHTDVQEYIGSYVASEDGRLVFREGVLVEAMRKGHWIILDELNLAPCDVLEALNRVLDDNRELFIPETQTVVKAHENFMLFATQNPPGVYGGRKVLSRAFRNRFVELHFDEIPADELQIILQKRCRMPESYCKQVIGVMTELQIRRKSTATFAGKKGFITLRDLFRWAERYRLAPDTGTDLYDWSQHLADEGYLVLSSKVRHPDECQQIIQVLKKHLRRDVDPANLFNLTEKTSSVTRSILESLSQCVPGFEHIVWTSQMRRLAVLLKKCIQFKEPVLLVGETGGGKTTVCQLLAAMSGKELYSVNCHMHTEAADFLGSLRPVRDQSDRLFEWVDGPLVQAMLQGGLFLADEISLADDSVLERMNSLLEPERKLLVPEKNSDSASITAAESFVFVGTMNPGGDYGKKELSPALRNRFTEIWCEGYALDEDLRLIIAHNLNQEPRERIAVSMMDFLKWLRTQELGRKLTISVRDVLTWVDFLNKCRLPVGVGLYHGACLSFVDGLGSGLTASESHEKLRAFKSLTFTFLKDQCTSLGSTLTDANDLLTLRNGKLGVEPFYIDLGPCPAKNQRFCFESKTTGRNLVKLLRGLQLRKPVLLEGSPGVGKTSLVSALASASGNRLFRLNLSDQTDISDLFGADLPLENGKPGQFAWRDGPFLRAMRSGDWILLDELNLASQSVLEGLNGCLDHRGEVYVPELGRTFSVDPRTKLFACQNPLAQGGDRRGLPKSFLNRFTQVFVDVLEEEDLVFILSNQFPALPRDLLEKLIRLNQRLSKEAGRSWAISGAPWEMNLRDSSRCCELIARTAKDGKFDPGRGVDLIYVARMRTDEDKDKVREIYTELFPEDPLPRKQFPIFFGDQEVLIDEEVLKKTEYSVEEQEKDLLLLRGQKEALRNLAQCVNMNWMSIIIGGSGSGKSSLVKFLSNVAGQKLRTLPVNSAMDTTELLGGFEQTDYGRHFEELLEKTEAAAVEILRGKLLDGKLSEIRRIEELLENVRHFSRDEKSESLACQVRYFLDRAANLEDLLSALISDGTAGKSVLLGIQGKLDDLRKIVAEEKCLNAGGKFEWVDSVLVKCLKEGSWLLVDQVNLCSPAVLDRLNGLLEPGGVLAIGEKGIGALGEVYTVEPHPNFRLFLAMDPRHGEISRAMRNRGVEISLPPTREPSRLNSLDLASLLNVHGILESSQRNLLMAIPQELPWRIGVREFLQLAESAGTRIQMGFEVLEAVRAACREVFWFLEENERRILLERVEDAWIESGASYHNVNVEKLTLRLRDLKWNSRLAVVEQEGFLLKVISQMTKSGTSNLHTDNLLDEILRTPELPGLIKHFLLDFCERTLTSDLEIRQRWMQETLPSSLHPKIEPLCDEIRKFGPKGFPREQQLRFHCLAAILYLRTMIVAEEGAPGATEKAVTLKKYSEAVAAGRVTSGPKNIPLISHYSRLLDTGLTALLSVLRDKNLDLDSEGYLQLRARVKWLQRLQSLGESLLVDGAGRFMVEELCSRLRVHFHWFRKRLFDWLLARYPQIQLETESELKLQDFLSVLKQIPSKTEENPSRKTSKRVRRLLDRPIPRKSSRSIEFHEKYLKMRKKFVVNDEDLTENKKLLDKVKFLSCKQVQGCRRTLIQVLWEVLRGEDLFLRDSQTETEKRLDEVWQKHSPEALKSNRLEKAEENIELAGPVQLNEPKNTTRTKNDVEKMEIEILDQEKSDDKPEEEMELENWPILEYFYLIFTNRFLAKVSKGLEDFSDNPDGPLGNRETGDLKILDGLESVPTIPPDLIALMKVLEGGNPKRTDQILLLQSLFSGFIDFLGNSFVNNKCDAVCRGGSKPEEEFNNSLNISPGFKKSRILGLLRDLIQDDGSSKIKLRSARSQTVQRASLLNLLWRNSVVLNSERFDPSSNDSLLLTFVTNYLLNAIHRSETQENALQEVTTTEGGQEKSKADPSSDKDESTEMQVEEAEKADRVESRETQLKRFLSEGKIFQDNQLLGSLKNLLNLRTENNFERGTAWLLVGQVYLVIFRDLGPMDPVEKLALKSRYLQEDIADLEESLLVDNLQDVVLEAGEVERRRVKEDFLKDLGASRESLGRVQAARPAGEFLKLKQELRNFCGSVGSVETIDRMLAKVRDLGSALGDTDSGNSGNPGQSGDPERLAICDSGNPGMEGAENPELGSEIEKISKNRKDRRRVCVDQGKVREIRIWQLSIERFSKKLTEKFLPMFPDLVSPILFAVSCLRHGLDLVLQEAESVCKQSEALLLGRLLRFPILGPGTKNHHDFLTLCLSEDLFHLVRGQRSNSEADRDMGAELELMMIGLKEAENLNRYSRVDRRLFRRLERVFKRIVSIWRKQEQEREEKLKEEESLFRTIRSKEDVDDFQDMFARSEEEFLDENELVTLESRTKLAVERNTLKEFDLEEYKLERENLERHKLGTTDQERKETVDLLIMEKRHRYQAERMEVEDTLKKYKAVAVRGHKAKLKKAKRTSSESPDRKPLETVESLSSFLQVANADSRPKKYNFLKERLEKCNFEIFRLEKYSALTGPDFSSPMNTSERGGFGSGKGTISKEAAIEILRIHSNMFEDTTSTVLQESVDFVGPLTRRFKLFHPEDPPESLTGLCSPGLSVLLSRKTGPRQGRSRRIQDFYKDPNFNEVQTCLPICQSLEEKIDTFLLDWPENPLLLSIKRVLERILDFSIEEPLSKFLTGLELLLPKIRQWEENARSDLSLADFMEAVGQRILAWRKLEILRWKESLEILEERLREEASIWWFFLFDLVDQFLEQDPRNVHEEESDTKENVLQLRSGLKITRGTSDHSPSKSETKELEHNSDELQLDPGSDLEQETQTEPDAKQEEPGIPRQKIVDSLEFFLSESPLIQFRSRLNLILLFWKHLEGLGRTENMEILEYLEHNGSLERLKRLAALKEHSGWDRKCLTEQEVLEVLRDLESLDDPRNVENWKRVESFESFQEFRGVWQSLGNLRDPASEETRQVLQNLEVLNKGRTFGLWSQGNLGTHLRNPNLIELSSIFWNVYCYYKQYLPEVESRVAQRKKPIEKKLKDLVKISRWSDVSFWALKETTEKTRRSLHKFAKEFEKSVSERVSSQTLKPGSPGLADTSVCLIPVQEPGFNLEATPPGAHSPHFARFLKKARKICSEVVTKSPYQGMLEELEEFFVSSFQEGRSLKDFVPDKNAGKSWAKSLQQKKRLALGNYFKALTRLGVSYRLGILKWKHRKQEILDFACPGTDFEKILTELELQTGARKLTGLDRYYYGSQIGFNELEAVARVGNSDLGPQNLEKCRGFSAHLLYLANKQKKALSQFITEFSKLRRLLKNLTEAQNTTWTDLSDIDPDKKELFLNDPPDDEETSKEVEEKEATKKVLTIPSNRIPAQRDLLEGLRANRDLLTSLEIGITQFLVFLDSCPTQSTGHLDIVPRNIPVLQEERFSEVSQKTKQSLQTVERLRLESETIFRFLDNFSGIEDLPLMHKGHVEFLDRCYKELQEIRENLIFVRKEFIVEDLEHPISETLQTFIESILLERKKFDSIRNYTKRLNVTEKLDRTRRQAAELFDVKLENLISDVLLVIQDKYLKLKKDTEVKDEKEEGEFDENLLTEKLITGLRKDVLELKVKKVRRKLGTVFKDLHGMDWCGANCCLRLLLGKLSILEQYTKLTEFYLLKQLSAFRLTVKSLFLQVAVFQDLATNGFCPPKQADGQEGEEEGQTKGGMGLGDGEGEKDVSDRIESEDQLEEAKKKEDYEKQEESKTCPEEKKGIEMSEDFEGELQDLENQEDQEDEDKSDEEEDDLEKQMGETEQNADKLDKEIWEDEDEEQSGETNQDQEEKGQGKDKSKEISAKEDGKNAPDDEDDGLEEEKDQKKEINEMEEPEVDEDQINPYHNKQAPDLEPEPMDLADDLDLDNNEDGEKKGEEEGDPFDVDEMKKKMPQVKETEEEAEEDKEQKKKKEDETDSSDEEEEAKEKTKEGEEKEKGEAEENEEGENEDKDGLDQEKEGDSAEEKKEDSGEDKVEESSEKRRGPEEDKEEDEENLEKEGNPEEENQEKGENPEDKDASSEAQEKEEKDPSTKETEESKMEAEEPEKLESEKEEKDVSSSNDKAATELDNQDQVKSSEDSSKDLVKGSSKEESSSKETEENYEEDSKEQKGTGSSEAKEDSGHSGQSEKRNVPGSRNEKQERKEERRKAGRSEEKKSLMEKHRSRAKKQKMAPEHKGQEEETEDKPMEVEDKELFEHVDKAEEFDSAAVDAATEEQAKKQVPDLEEEDPQESELKMAETDGPDEPQTKEDTPEDIAMHEEPEEDPNRPPIQNKESEKVQEPNKDKSKGSGEDGAEAGAMVEIEGELQQTVKVPRGESTIHANLELDDSAVVEEKRVQVEEMISQLGSVNRVVSEQAYAIWTSLSSITEAPARDLAERLRLVLEPTKISRLKGDYRTGKRLNMRKIIPYIASEFRKDKIWLRRTKPSRRDYQIVLAIDDSSSMADNHSKELAFESLSLISKAMVYLEVGQLSVVSFGEGVNVLHPLGENFTEETGARLIQEMKFEQKKTMVSELVNYAVEMFERQGSTSSENARLLTILSDGRGMFSEGTEKVNLAVRRAKQANIFIVFVVVDNPLNKDSILDIRMPVFESGRLVGIKSYMDSFPFPFYIILRDLEALPNILSDALRQWFELVGKIDT